VTVSPTVTSPAVHVEVQPTPIIVKIDEFPLPAPIVQVTVPQPVVSLLLAPLAEEVGELRLLVARQTAHLVKAAMQLQISLVLSALIIGIAIFMR
jgi:hypothetical protein